MKAMKIPENATVFCLGPSGTYSHEAAEALFPNGCGLSFCGSNREAIDRVADGGADSLFAVVPAANSDIGLIPEVRDFWLSLLDCPDPEASASVGVVAELRMPIVHCLAARENRTLARILSRPEALSQCSRQIAATGLVTQACLSTAEAARQVGRGGSEMDGTGVICSRFAAETYGLAVLHPNFANRSDNETRFHVISGAPGPEPTGSDTTAILFEVPNRNSALVRALHAVSDNDVGMSDLKTIELSPGRFAHYVEVGCHRDDERGRKLVAQLRLHVMDRRLLVLGSYPSTERASRGGAV